MVRVSTSLLNALNASEVVGDASRIAFNEKWKNAMESLLFFVVLAISYTTSDNKQSTVPFIDCLFIEMVPRCTAIRYSIFWPIHCLLVVTIVWIFNTIPILVRWLLQSIFLHLNQPEMCSIYHVIIVQCLSLLQFYWNCSLIVGRHSVDIGYSHESHGSLGH